MGADPSRSDGALLLALNHEIIAQGLYDRDFVARYTRGGHWSSSIPNRRGMACLPQTRTAIQSILSTRSATPGCGRSRRSPAQGAMGGRFNTREFFHGRTRALVRAVRGSFLVLVFPVPALLQALGPQSAALLGAAFLTQYAGLLAERWYFFAEAKHAQNLYYQAIA